MNAQLASLLSELIDLGAELVERNLVLGSGGNLSARWNDIVYITRSGALLHQLTPDDFLPVFLDKPYHRPSTQPRPSVETPMHLAAYQARPKTRIVVHCHPVHAIAWAMQERPLPACTPDFALYVGAEAPTLPFHVPGSESLAAAVTAWLPTHPVLLLGNHGVLVCGEDVRKARLRVLYVDETAHICLLAAAAGALRPLQPDEFDRIIATYGRK
ncbi:MAG: class II aldolase/adducin family protein [Chloroflexi bacterium]|nr:class II aldolase/adducin family protein [Chloroflexota bacterium]